MPLVTCKRCGARVSDEYSYCINCQAALTMEAKATEAPLRSLRPSPNLWQWLFSPLDSKRKAKYRLRSGTRQGAVAGAIVGLIHGIFGGSYFLIILDPILKPALTEFVVRDYGARGLRTLPTLWNIFLAVALIGLPLFGAITGAVFGVLFIAFRRRLPGSTIIRKAVLFSLILLTISLLSSLRRYLIPRNPRIIALLSGFEYLELVSIAISVIEYPLLGYLFGYLLERRLKSIST